MEATRELEPVGLEVVRDCEWKAKPCGECEKAKTNAVHRPGSPGYHPYKRRQGCARCGRPKNDPGHLGTPESFNIFASGSWEAYQTAKQRWHKVLVPLLVSSGLPHGLARVVVEGECSFGDARPRDQGNHRVVLEKALGDVLEHGDPDRGVGGWLPDDTWDRYEFGNLIRREEPGVNRLRLTLFPTLALSELEAQPLAEPVDAMALFG